MSAYRQRNTRTRGGTGADIVLNSGYLNPNPQYGTSHGPGPREYAAQNVSQQMSNLNLNPKPAPYSPQGQQGGGYTAPGGRQPWQSDTYGKGGGPASPSWQREPGLQPSAPAMRPSQPPAPAWQPRHVPPAPVAVPNAQVSGHKWQPPSVRPAAPHQGQFGAPSSGRGGTRGRKGDASMRQGDATRIPVCSQCGGPVRGPFVLALGKSWCPNHFCCANCNCKLIDIGFIEEGGKLYCEKDYEMYFAPHCKKCNQAIIGDCVHAMNFEYHPHCFVCTHCRQPIGNSGFHMEDGQPFCERDWMQMFQTKCAACDFPVEPGDHWVEAMGSNYHADCFCCAVCRKPLEGQTFYAKDGRAYCSQHNKGRF